MRSGQQIVLDAEAALRPEKDADWSAAATLWAGQVFTCPSVRPTRHQSGKRAHHCV